MMTPHASNPVEHPKWRSLVVEQGMLGVANDELGGLPEAAETEACTKPQLSRHSHIRQPLFPEHIKVFKWR